ncbi:MAG: tetratricopeptide repeat protein [Alkalispirochaeta sp.]
MQGYNQDEHYIDAMGKYLSGQWAEADAAFKALDEKYQGESFIKLLRGNIAYSRGELEDAVDRYNEAIEARPKFGNAYYKLGVCLYRMGRLKQALEAFQSVVNMGSQSHAMAQYFVGLIHLFLGEDHAAAQAFDGFHTASPESRIANFYLAQLKIKHKEFDEALQLLGDLVDETPDFAEVHYMLGTVHYGLHNNTEAIKCFQRALDLNPEDERSKTKLTLLTDVQWP